MSNVFSASLAGLNGAVQQFEAATARIVGAPAAPAAPGSASVPLDSVEIVGSRAPGGTLAAVTDVMAARYSVNANAKALTIVVQAQKALLDIKI